jgi:hypothetical protein
MRGYLAPTAGYKLIQRTWISISARSPKVDGCAWVKSESPSLRLNGWKILTLPSSSVASAEILLLLAYLFKNFRLSLPSDFRMPDIQDLYVNRFPTGLPVHFEKL